MNVSTDVRPVQARVEHWAAATPDAIAVVAGNERLTYRALNERANRLARHLQRHGCGSGIVAIALPREAELVVAMLAVLKAGAAYLPLDLANPPERLEFIVEDARARAVLARRDAGWAPQASSSATLWLDDAADDIDGDEGTNPATPIDCDSLAYVIYTSGSTGKPKGCLTLHRNLARLFDAARARFEFRAGDAWTCFHSQAFDFSVWEIWGPLSTGGTVVVVPQCIAREPERFWRLVCDERIAILCQTPSAFRQLLPVVGPSRAADAGAGRDLRYVILGGEALEPRSLAPWFECFGDQSPQLINGYGPTETTVFATFHRVLASEVDRPGPSNIGFPLGDLAVSILDSHGTPLPAAKSGKS